MALTKINYTGQGVVPHAKMPTGSVLQTLSAINSSGEITVATTTATDIITLNITPKSTSSKILVTFSGGEFGYYDGATYQSYIDMYRDSTAIMKVRHSNRASEQNELAGGASLVYLDSPSTTSQITYRIKVNTNTGNSVFITRSDDTSRITLTAMEIAG